MFAIALVPAVPAVGVGKHESSKDLAAEVCEDMVGDAVVAAAGMPLSGPQSGSWDGPRYTCTYPLGNQGTLTLTVDVAADKRAAKRRFSALRRTANTKTPLFGIGDAAFQNPNDGLTARKDNFVLTVDSSQVVRQLDRDAIIWATTLAVFTCW